jgi:hypothetical protein
MGFKVDFDPLVGITPMAERSGFARAQAVHNRRAWYPSFPKPVVEVGKSNL